MSITRATVASGDQLSGQFNLHDGKRNNVFGLMVGAVTSCQAYLHVNFDTTSADFRRLWDEDGAAEFTWDLGPGSAALFTDKLAPFNYARIELSVAQTDAASFAIVTRP